jgi:hypothetical protein
MNTSSRIIDLANILEEAISYENWEMVEDVSRELYLLYEELESDFPLEFDENENDLY